MQEKIFWLLNCTINNMVLELLPFLTLELKDKYKKHKYWIFTAVNIFDLFLWRRTPTILSAVYVLALPFLITTVFFKDIAWKKILLSFLYNAISLSIEFISIAYLIIFLKGTFETDILEYTSKYYAATTFNNMLYFIFVLLTVVLWKYFIDGERSKDFLLFLTISIYQLILTGIFVSFSSDYTHPVMWTGLLLVIMNFSVDIIVFFFIKQLAKKQLMEAELAQLHYSRKRELARYQELEIQLKTLREQRHEFANQMQTVAMMMEQHAPAKQIEAYLADVLNTVT